MVGVTGPTTTSRICCASSRECNAGWAQNEPDTGRSLRVSRPP
jgi:hypothetical protein